MGWRSRGEPGHKSLPERVACVLRPVWFRRVFEPIVRGCFADCAEKPHGGARKLACGGQTRSVPRYAIPSCDFAPARVLAIWSSSGWGLKRAIGSDGHTTSLRGMTTGQSSRRRPKSCPRSTSTASERPRMRPTHVGKLRTGTRSAQTREKTSPQQVRGISRNPLRTPGQLLLRLTSRASAGRPLRTCH